MIGHGSPSASRGRANPLARSCIGTRVIPAVWAVSLIAILAGPTWASTLRVRISWGGGTARRWSGEVRLSQGTMAQPRLLGIDADEPGSMWLAVGRQALNIRQPRARSYDAVDVRLDAPLSANLRVSLRSDGPRQGAGNDVAESVEIPLRDLIDGAINRQLDGSGNRLFIQRTPGDQLRVEGLPDSLVFSPGDTLRATLRPHLLPVEEGTKLSVAVQLRGGAPLSSPRAVLSESHPIRAGEPNAIPLEMVLPREEGVYELVLSATRAGWPNPVQRPLRWKETVAERKVQMVVVDDKPLGGGRQAGYAEFGDDGQWATVAQIDPANPRLSELLAKLPQWNATPQLPSMPKLPSVSRMWKGPLGNDRMSIEEHALGSVARLAPSSQSPDVSWQAYALPVEQPGRPHILEVDYPSDVAQALGISVMEPNSSGALVPIGLDSGVESSPSALSPDDKPRWERHRLIFWPRTTSPMVLVYNLRDHIPARYGEIRLLAGPRRLPSSGASSMVGGRRLAACMDRPLLPENFSAPEAFDSTIQRGLDDWATFYLSGTRLVEYLDHVGYGGLMLGVLADGSAIYPSELLQPTPRHDTGPLSHAASDPVRKDVLELLCRLFDRRRLKLVPMLDFSAPLPALEKRVREGGPAADGLQPVGADGRTWIETHSAQRGMGVYYNVLHPDVQAAVLDVMGELVDRYGGHPSLAGVAIQLTADGYAQLPGPAWCLDDATIRRFSNETGIRVPGSGPGRFAERARFLTRTAAREAWLRWRAEQIRQFHERLRRRIVAARPDARLYLAGTRWFAGEEIVDALRPTLGDRITATEALLQIGIDPELYAGDDSPVLLRPRWSIGGEASTLGAIERELALAPDFDRVFRSMQSRAALWYHPPRKRRVPSFEAKSPYRPCYVSLFAQPSPSAEANRRRLARTLAASDASVIFDGGWMLPMGQEDALRPWLEAYRRLPAVRFHTVEGVRGASQPVVFRYASYGSETYLYAVNEAPFPVDASLSLQAPEGCQIAELTGRRSIAPLRPGGRNGSTGRRESARSGGFGSNGARVPMSWHLRLQPYELVAVRLSAASVQPTDARAEFSPAVADALERRINDLGLRAASLHSVQPKALLANPGFEQQPSDGSPGAAEIPGWLSTSGEEGVRVELTDAVARGGNRSVHLQSNGPVAALASRRFTVPATGRLSMSVWLRVADTSRQPPLRLAVEGDFGRLPYRFAPVGAAPGRGAPQFPIGTQWSQFVFPVSDLPLEPGCQVSVRFDMMGPGEVWIDDVEIFDLALNRRELVELSKLITLIDVKRQHGQVADCLQLLEGHWPRLLEQHVDLPSHMRGDGLAERRDEQQRDAQRDTPDRTSLLDRMRDMLPKKLW